MAIYMAINITFITLFVLFILAIPLAIATIELIEKLKERKSLTIKIKYFEGAKKLKKIDKGDWIDLSTNETVYLKKGEFKLIPLGVAMKLPKGYEANIVPRSSMYKNFKILQTNSFGVIDSTYCRDSDEWQLTVIAMEDTIIHKGDRLCQFRLNKIQPAVKFNTVNCLEENNRGGFGSTGK